MPSKTRAYLRPIGVIAGSAARPALEAGWALPLAGSDRHAFTGCEIWLRNGRTITSHVVRAVEVSGFANHQPSDVREEIETGLARLAQPPMWPAGLPASSPVIMGVVNVTPDSFSDGGLFRDTEAAVTQGRKLWREGAGIVDVGGESTRPGAAPVAVDEELRRVVPVIEALAADGILVSIDTRHAAVMEAAVAAGARMINDVSALRHDPGSIEVVRRSGLPVVLMHSRGEPATMQHEPHYDRAMLDVYDHLRARIAACLAARIDKTQLVIDPGIGFGKTLDHNLDILHHAWIYRALGLPVMLGVSRKSFIARIAEDAPPDARLPGSIAAALRGLASGVCILRVHDVAATQQAVRVAQAIWAY